MLIGATFTEFFEDVFKNINLKTIAILLIGILIGLILAGCIYSIILIVSLKSDKKMKQANLISIKEEKILDLINKTKKSYLDNTVGFTIGEKSKYLGHIIKDLSNQIAGYYYPNSKYPLYELTIEEILTLLIYVSERVDKILEKSIYRPFRKLSISQIVKIMETRKNSENSKVVKVAEKSLTASKAGMMVLNYANPYYWLKKIVFGGASTYTTNKIALVIIDVVADEINKLYSKRIFNTEDNFNSLIDENLKQIEKEFMKEVEDHE